MGCCVQMEDVEIEDVDMCVWAEQMGRVLGRLIVFSPVTTHVHI